MVSKANGDSAINNNLTQIKTYVGSDGKLHFTDVSGADTVLNFSKKCISLGIFSSSQNVDIKSKISDWQNLSVQNFRILQSPNSITSMTGGDDSTNTMVSKAIYYPGALSYNNGAGILTITLPRVWHSYWRYTHNEPYYETTFNLPVEVICGEFN